jgi:hypothetical protein
MPASYSILPHLNLVRVRYEGVLTAEESMNLFVSHATSRDARAGRPVFVDMSGLERVIMGETSLLRYTQTKMSVLDPSLPLLRLAFYAPQPHQAALATAYAELVDTSEQVSATVHGDAAEALRALGKTDNAPEDVLV